MVLQRVPFPSIPAVDSPNNNNFADVLGQKGDGSSGDSLYSLAHILNDHVHSPCWVYPSLAPGTLITAGGGAWNLGAFAQVIPAAAKNQPFDIHYISVEQISANDVYELVLYYGPTDLECGRVRFTKNAVQDGTMNVPMQTPVLPADSRIRAKIASGAGGNNVNISLFGHSY